MNKIAMTNTNFARYAKSKSRDRTSGKKYNVVCAQVILRTNGQIDSNV